MKDSSNNKQVIDNFDEFANVFLVYGSLLSPAELHGLITGFLVTGSRLTHDQWLEVIYNQMGIDDMQDSAHQQKMHNLHALPLQQLTGGEFGFRLLLPDDDTELSQRLASIGAWCSGFLSGFGLGQTHFSQENNHVNNKHKQDANLSSETQDTLSAFFDIAQVAHDAEEETSEQQEQNEQNYMMLVEYIRLSVTSMFEQYQPDNLGTQQNTNNTSTTH